MVILTNCKTGAWRRFASEGQARRAATHMGWVDYIVEHEQ